jgi:T5orf172 domain
MEKRITRAQAQIDKLNASNSTLVTDDFLKLKLRELYLTHEYREKSKAERDERAEAARAAREEQRLPRDVEEAQADEQHYERLLAKAKAEAASVVGPQLEAFSEQVKVLERDLAEAHAKAERAQAMAERTRSGYVYIVSNIGSFGENVVKIGLTRRLDPLDRVRELGDASVPFAFDTHAIIYSDDAPTLERALHNEFELTRINAQNYRKEFFRTSLDAVEAALKRVAPSAAFFKDIEAQEYHETLARRRVALEQVNQVESLSFPVTL